MTTKITITKTPRTSKPYGAEVAALNAYNNWEAKDLTVEDFFDLVANKGYSFKLANLKFRTKCVKNENGNYSVGEKNCSPSNLLAFDVDEGTTSAEEYVDTVLAPKGLTPSFVAYSWNDCVKAPYALRAEYAAKAGKPVNEDKRKFHVVFVLKETVELEIVKNYLTKMIKLFGADKACKDFARYFNGSTLGGTVYNVEPIDFNALPYAAEASKPYVEAEVAKADTKHRARKVKTLCAHYNLTPDTVVEVPGEKYLPDYLRNWKLFKRLEDGERLEYDERLALFSQLAFVRWGANSRTDKLNEYVEERLNACSDYENVEAKIKEYYDAKSFAIFERPLSDLGGLTITEHLTIVFNGGLIPVDLTGAVPVGEVEDELYNIMSEAVDTDGLDVITVQCGVGKTETAAKVVSELIKRGKKVIYVGKAYRNLEDFAERGKRYGFKVAVCPEKKKLEGLDAVRAACGFPTATTPERSDFFKKMRLEDCPFEDCRCYAVTHALFNVYPYFPDNAVYIVDEDNTDIYSTVAAFTPEQLGRIEALSIFVGGKHLKLDWGEYGDALLNSIDGTELPCAFIPSTLKTALFGDFEGEEAKEDLAQKALNGEIPLAPYGRYAENPDDYTMFVARNQAGEVVFSIAPKTYMPVDKNLTLLTATPKEQLITQRASDSVRFHRLKRVKPEGLNVQIIFPSLRKNAGTNEQKDRFTRAVAALDRLKDVIKESFPDFAAQADEPFHWIVDRKWTDEGEKLGLNLAKFYDGSLMYNGNVAGYDDLKGKNVVSFGSIKRPSDVYYQLYYAYVWRPGMPALKVEDGFDKVDGVAKLRFNVDVMTKIRDEDNEGDLMQSVGRPRTVREKVISLCCSNVRCPDTTYFFYI
ncbi:MAG: hypothetical protein MJ168_13030 [Clostridia bacterium]|nr:hypothetical protein [Clostridia bacterium]